MNIRKRCAACTRGDRERVSLSDFIQGGTTRIAGLYILHRKNIEGWGWGERGAFYPKKVTLIIHGLHVMVAVTDTAAPLPPL